MDIFSIGHSTREIAEFVALLQQVKIDTLIDVRSIPMSRRCPQFNYDVVGHHMKDVGIEYIREPLLGGFKKKSKTVDPKVNGWWQHPSFHNYADYQMSSDFMYGLNHLIRYALDGHKVAYFCSEAEWWRCHRRIITDNLIAQGYDPKHIMGKGKVSLAELSEGARLGAGNRLAYPDMSNLTEQLSLI